MSIKYRPDIDGLRAVAVMLVVVYHAGLPYISGGFIGVDVFFVISGYLITTIIKKEIESGSFTYKSFYLRRINRIYPALLTCLTITCISGFFILLPDDSASLFLSSFFSLISLSNFYFLHEVGSYFAQSTESMPLLHTWSLGVEEQFYLFSPFLIAAISKIKISYQKAIIFSLLVSLLALSVYGSVHDKSAAYYMLPYRAFELLIGSYLAYSSVTQNLSKKTSITMQVIGLVFIVYYSITLDKSSTFPGLYALIPCVGAAMIIAGGYSRSGIIYRFLSLKLVNFTGKISYSMYLYHWPLIAYMHYIGVTFNVAISIFIVIASYTMASISYFLIERPTRSTSKGFKFNAIAYVATPILVLFTLNMLSIKYGGLSWANSTGVEFSTKNLPSHFYENCTDKYLLDKSHICKLGTKGKAETLIIGDSMAGSFFPFIDYLANDAGISVDATTSSGLPPVRGIQSYDKNNNLYKLRTPDTIRYNEDRLDLAKSYKHVVISANWGNGDDYFTGDASKESILATVKELVNSGVDVTILLKPNGAYQESFNKIKSERIQGNDLSNSFVYKKQGLNKQADDVIKRMSNVHVIDVNDVLCRDNYCKLDVDGYLVFFDPDHLNISGSKSLGRKYKELMGNFLKG